MTAVTSTATARNSHGALVPMLRGGWAVTVRRKVT